MKLFVIWPQYFSILAIYIILPSLLRLYNTLVVAILVLVTWNLGHRLLNNWSLFAIFNSKNLEFTWTLLPRVYVLFCSVPGCRYLYSIETVHFGPISVVLGNQWYWTYQQGTSAEYQSTLYRGALTSTSMMTNRWAMRYWAVSSNDVIHNWGIARVSDRTLGIKMDAYPGRINVACHDRVRPSGIYLRYCSELCRAHHAYMPISLVCYYY